MNYGRKPSLLPAILMSLAMNTSASREALKFPLGESNDCPVDLERKRRHDAERIAAAEAKRARKAARRGK